MLGLLLGRKGADKSEVIAEFREAVRLRPDFAQAYNNLGLVLTQTDDDEGAVAAFHEAIRIRPDYADAHANLGAALIPTDGEQAIRELEKAVALEPDVCESPVQSGDGLRCQPEVWSSERDRAVAQGDRDLTRVRASPPRTG